jgi:large subunit ribosomal protein L32e
MSEKMRLLKLKKKLKQGKPSFKRQEQDFETRLRKTWRKPKGRKSDLRRKFKGRGSRPSPGHGSPRAVKGLNRLGLREVRVFSIKELDSLDPKTHSVIIGSSVGRRKRLEILSRAGELGLRVEN